MPLTAGTRLGPYEIVSPLGAGGMGEVYRARDTKLGREVAVKVISESFVHDPERVARFEREAQLLASLNHAHIATIHGLEQSSGTQFLVMELVDGETLADRLRSGAVPVSEALTIAGQIADALQAAHEKGIIHRDLKPANIALTATGQVKVLDFGLAKALDPAASGAHVSMSPTLTLGATQAGVILGTAAYMAPEQAKGRPADKRSDIWAFGCVLFEMLTAQRAFPGDDVTDTLATVLKSDPDWRALPPAVGPALRRLLRQCLEKDRSRRTSEIAVAVFVIHDVLGGADVAMAAAPPRRARRAIVAASVALSAISVAAAGWLWLVPRVAPPRIVRFDVTPGSDAPLTVGPAGANLAISRDGNRIVYHARRGSAVTLDLRRLDTGDGLALPETDGATHAAFSPDGQSLAFFKAGKLYKLVIDSRLLTVLCDVASVSGISWAAEEQIVFAKPGTLGGLFRVSAAGGAPELIAAPDAKAGEQDYGIPDATPDGQAVLFVIRAVAGDGSQLQVAARSLASGVQKVLAAGAVAPKYLESGHLLYAQGGALLAVRFDAARLAVIGAAVPVINGIVTKGGTANYDVSADGTLVYVPGSTVTYISRFIWKDRTGRTTGAIGADLEFPRYARLSPDGRRFVATIGPAQEGHVWVYDAVGASQPYKLTFNSHNTGPVWSPDGSKVAFLSTRDGPIRNLFVVPADGSVLEPSRLVTSDKDKAGLTWSPDGQWLLYRQLGDLTRSDLWLQEARPDGKARPWLQTAFAESEATFSHDGKWVAYVSDQTGIDEVWVRPFPGPGSPTRISSNGGHDPVWSKDDGELFYVDGAKLMVAAVMARDPLQLGAPRALFDGGFIQWEPNTPRTFDVSSDGRFLMVEPTATYSQRFNVVLNWGEELKTRVPVK